MIDVINSKISGTITFHWTVTSDEYLYVLPISYDNNNCNVNDLETFESDYNILKTFFNNIEIINKGITNNSMFMLFRNIHTLKFIIPI